MKGFKKYIPIALLIASLGLGFNAGCTQKQKANGALKEIKITSYHYKDYLLGTDRLDTVIIEKILTDGTKITESYGKGCDRVYYKKYVEKKLDDITKITQYYKISDKEPYITEIEKVLADGTKIVEYKNSNGKIDAKSITRKLDNKTEVTEHYKTEYYIFDKLNSKTIKKELEDRTQIEIDNDADGKVDEIKTEKKLSDGTKIRDYKAPDGKVYYTEIEKRPNDTTRIIEYKIPGDKSIITIERLLADGTKIKEIDDGADGRIDRAIIGEMIIKIKPYSDKESGE